MEARFLEADDSVMDRMERCGRGIEERKKSESSLGAVNGGHHMHFADSDVRTLLPEIRLRGKELAADRLNLI